MSLLINSTETVFLIVQVLAVSFLAILFLQSGLDKVVDKKGNLDWLSSHFANSPFKNFVPVLFFTITVVELLSGILNLLGVVFLLLEGSLMLALYGTILASVALIMLFLGQRIAKDYVGAQSIVSYFILTILTLLVFGYTM
ncbi:MAG TPA: DoxX family protein [Flavobacteriales bacterium]|nr:DoxX family protein [Flavobacteriales bacterium]|tara:strand:+ start:995 stop:1417 length:423 start_codon:yes stop_codon:yes gene_type:complete